MALRFEAGRSGCRALASMAGAAEREEGRHVGSAQGRAGRGPPPIGGTADREGASGSGSTGPDGTASTGGSIVAWARPHCAPRTG